MPSSSAGDTCATAGTAFRRAASRSADKPACADLLRWRVERGPRAAARGRDRQREPRAAIARRSVESGRAVYVATGDAADARKIAALQSQGVRVLGVGGGAAEPKAAGSSTRWRANRCERRHDRRRRGIPCARGRRRLDRLYPALACRLLGGWRSTLCCSARRSKATAGFKLKAAAIATPREAAGSAVEQLFAILDHERLSAAHRISPRALGDRYPPTRAHSEPAGTGTRRYTGDRRTPRIKGSATATIASWRELHWRR